MGAEEELKVQVDDVGKGSASPPQPPNPAGGLRGKSCKGCLYYSNQKSRSQRPTCLGFSRSIQQVPRYVVGETESQASKEGRTLTDFKYACIGYSVFLEKNAQSSDQQKKESELPFCVGLEVLLDKRTTPAPQVQEHARKNEDYHTFRPQHTHEPANAIADDYLNRRLRSRDSVTPKIIADSQEVLPWWLPVLQKMRIKLEIALRVPLTTSSILMESDPSEACFVDQEPCSALQGLPGSHS